MDREVSKEQQTRHIYDGTLMSSNIRAYSKLMLSNLPSRWQFRQKPFAIGVLQSITKIVEAVGIEPTSEAWGPRISAGAPLSQSAAFRD